MSIKTIKNKLINLPYIPDDRSTSKTEDPVSNNNYLVMEIESNSPTLKFRESIRSKKCNGSSAKRSGFGSFSALYRHNLTTEDLNSSRSTNAIKIKRKKEKGDGIWNFFCCGFANDKP